MKTLLNSCHKVIVCKCWDSKDKPSSSMTMRGGFRFPLQNHKEQLLNLRVLHLVSVQHKLILPGSKPQEDWETAEGEDQAISETKTVHMQFQLQKQCMYGEQFLLLGNDPLIGMWDPKNAVPLTWSDGHVWTVELELPVEKAIQFKFILKDEGGDIFWQPGSDRIVKTWETDKTITVCEDWDNAELQKIVGAEMSASQDEQQPAIEAQKFISPENLTDSQIGELPDDANRHSVTGSENISVQERIVESPVGPSIEESMSTVAENIILSSEDELGEPPVKHTTHLSNDFIDTKMGFENKGNATPVENTESVAVDVSSVYNEVPVLVPGLPSSGDAEEEATLDEVDKGNPVRELEYKDHNLPEFDKQISDDGTTQGANEMLTKQEELLENEVEETALMDATHSELPETSLLQNDIQWGHNTLQKLLTNLGLMKN